MAPFGPLYSLKSLPTPPIAYLSQDSCFLSRRGKASANDSLRCALFLKALSDNTKRLPHRRLVGFCRGGGDFVLGRA